MTYEEVLSHFSVKSRNSDRAQCVCPAHDDNKASLTISRGKNGNTVLCCHAGCSSDDVLAAVGLHMKDLFDDDDSSNNTDGEAWKRYIEAREKRKIEAVYHYTSLVTLEYSFTKVRLEGKRMIIGRLENGRFSYGLPRNTPRKSLKAIYGNLQNIVDAGTQCKPVFITEGEKDVDCLSQKGFAAWTYGSASDWQPEFAEFWAKYYGKFVVLADNDGAGFRVSKQIVEDFAKHGRTVPVIVPMRDVSHADISDFFEAGHTTEEFIKMVDEALTEGVSGVPTLLEETTVTEKTVSAVENATPVEEQGKPVDEVLSMLAYKIAPNGERKVRQTVRNMEIVLENDSRFMGKIRYNEFSQQICLGERAWGSGDDSEAFAILQSEYGLMSRNDFFDAIRNVAMRRRFHPVRDMLDSLEYKGDGHIRKLLPDYLGAENTDYNFEVMKLWMLGAVARTFDAGCKFDYCMILTGPQGIGKSTLLNRLALNDEWFNDSLADLDSDKAAQALLGTWVCELGELKALNRTGGGVDGVKRFLSARQDKIRLPYERRANIFLRQCVFAGTTNRTDFLQDETGNRRFLIVQTGIHEAPKNLFSTEAETDIEAAWAEAAHIYKTQKPELILPTSCLERAQELQEEALTDDGKTGLIQAFLENRQKTCVLEIWRECLNENGRPQKWQSSEISSIITALPDWTRAEKSIRFDGYGVQKGFIRCNQPCNHDVTKDQNGFSSTNNCTDEKPPF